MDLLKTLRALGLGVTIALAGVVSVHAEEQVAEEQSKENASVPAPAVETAEAGDWVTVTGEITQSSTTGFTLDDGGETVAIAMDGWVWYTEGAKLPDGDLVTVYGQMTAEENAGFSVQADSVYVHSRNTFYFAENSNKEVGYTLYANVAQFTDGTRVNVAGLVIWKEGRDMGIDTGSDLVNIDTRAVMDNKSNNDRFHQIQPGDIVAVSGTLDGTFLDQRQIEARTLLPIIFRDRGDVFLSLKMALSASGTSG